MKSLTNYIAFICGLLTVLVFVSVSMPANAQAPSIETQIREAWMANPMNRESIEADYWDEVRRQIAEVKPMLPMQISQSTFNIDVELVNKTIAYSYMVAMHVPKKDTAEMYQILRQRICSSKGSFFMLVHVEGSMIFAYYREGESVPFDIHAFTGKDCAQQSGI